MDSLANYGSDDDYDDSSDEQQPNWRQVDKNKRSIQKSQTEEQGQADANYEEVQMDLSEESNDGSKNSRETRERESSGEEKRNRDGFHDRREKDLSRSRRERSRDRDDDRMRERRDDNKYAQRSERHNNRDERGSNNRDRKYRKRSTSRENRRRSTSRDRSRRSSSRENRRRSNSRGRRRSGSRDRRYGSRSPQRRERQQRRSRSRSRSRYGGGGGGPRGRYGFPKGGVAQKNDSAETTIDAAGGSSDNNKDRFFMPGITGKYRDQIEKRKLLWQKKDSQNTSTASLVGAGSSAKVENRAKLGAGAASAQVAPNRTTKLWEATTFAQDQDGKVASKFKRLMGIKGQTQGGHSAPTDIIRKQEEMFTSMEQQYEVARTATHTMRGVGLGFSSGAFPR